MTKLVMSSATEEDFDNALSWYAQRSPQAAERFDIAISRAIETIASDPARFARCDDRHHFYLMRRFPYQIIFREDLDHWVVIAVAHTARKPSY